MTLLNWELAPDHVVILSDTLCLSGDDNRPRGFTSKVYLVPHLNGLMTGTGLSQFITRFFDYLINSVVADDIVHLAKYAPIILHDLWESMKPDLPQGATTTIYTFGLSSRAEQFVGFAYRSVNDFQMERLEFGLAAKPAPEKSRLDEVRDLEGLVRLAMHQQAADRELPRLARAGIGGDLWVYLMTKNDAGGVGVRVERVCSLPHRDEDRQISLAKLPENEGHPISVSILENDP